jgi:sugar phosphate isomerase/epimerase
MRLPFSVNHYLCPATMGLPAFLDVVSNAGFGGVGLTQRALAELPLPELRRELAARQLQVSSLNSAGFFLGEAEHVQQDINSRLVTAAAELQARVLNVLPGCDTGMSMPKNQASIAACFQALVGTAYTAGVQLAIEPLHATRARIKSCINTISAAAGTIGPSSSATLNLDMYHLWGDADLDQTVAGVGPRIGLVQICDIGDSGGDARRLPLDEGSVDWRPFVRRVQARHPDTPIELELFADRLPDRSAVDIIENAAKLLTPGEER